MDVYNEALQLKIALTDMVNDLINKHPVVKRTLKADKCIIVSEPNTKTHTIKVRLSPFDETVLELPYAPKIPLSQLKPNMCASVWYFYTINNGVVMQNNGWTAYGQDDLENLASGELNLIEAIQVLAEVVQKQETDIATLNEQVQNLTNDLQTTTQNLKTTSDTVTTLNEQVQNLTKQVQSLNSRVTALENK